MQKYIKHLNVIKFLMKNCFLFLHSIIYFAVRTETLRASCNINHFKSVNYIVYLI